MKTFMALAVVAVAIAGCGSSSSGTSSSATKAAASSGSGGGAYGSASNNANTANASTSSGSGAVAIQMHDNYFGTKVISGNPGSTVTVKLQNVGTHEHNFKILGQPKADADVKPGASGTATVKIPQSGTVQFFCEYHKGLGMVGTVKAT